MSNETWAVVATKSFSRAKSRLSAALSPHERSLIARKMFEQVLHSIQGSDVFRRTLVLTDGDDVMGIARARGALVHCDSTRSGSLSVIVDAGISKAVAGGATRLVVLMADLPYITSAALRSVVSALHSSDLVLVADRHGLGTNALGLNVRGPPLATAFGKEGSLIRHLAVARDARLDVRVLDAGRGLAHDLDTPADLPADWQTILRPG